MKLTKNTLAQSLIDWFSREKREFPWRGSKNPYIVWMSEIIMQQTRVQQGTPYFQRFMENYPTVRSLAESDEQDVLRLWQGLGYYSRARNMHYTARHIAYDRNDTFPDNYKELLTLKGVGPYSAAAIASICFGEATPVIDGNVFRVTSRLFELRDDINEASTRKKFADILQQHISLEFPGEFNQAMMELGSLVCTPTSPSCTLCPVREYCASRISGTQASLPVKTKKTKIRNRYFHYIVIRNANQLAMNKRQSNDIWKGLWDFLLIETEDDHVDLEDPLLKQIKIGSVEPPVRHILSHQHLFCRFYDLNISDKARFDEIMNKFDLEPFTLDEILTLPKPILIANYLVQYDI